MLFFLRNQNEKEVNWEADWIDLLNAASTQLCFLDRVEAPFPSSEASSSAGNITSTESLSTQDRPLEQERQSQTRLEVVHKRVEMPSDSIVYLLRRAGCHCVQNESVISFMKKEAHLILYSLLLSLFTQNDNDSKVITSREVLSSLSEKQGITVYGYGCRGYQGLWTKEIQVVLLQFHTELVLSSSAIGVMNDMCTDIALRVIHIIQMMRFNIRGKNKFYQSPAVVSSTCSKMYLPYLRRTLFDGSGVFCLRDTSEVTTSSSSSTFEQLESSASAHLHNRCVIDAVRVNQAVKVLLTGSVASHAMREIEQALNRCLKTENISNTSIPLNSLARLTMSPERLMVFAEREANMVCTEGGAVALAALMEYIMAEVLEQAGHVAKTEGSFIEAVHIAQAMQEDAELSTFFLCGTSVVGSHEHQGLIRQGGHLGVYGDKIGMIHEGRRFVDDVSQSLPSQGEGRASFSRLLHEKAASLPDRIIIDPRDGRHYMSVDSKPPTWLPMYELDAACSLPALARMDLAQLSLLESERDEMEKCRESFPHHYTLETHRSAAKYQVLLLPTHVFYLTSLQIANEIHPRFAGFSMEAVTILQEVVEWSLISMCQAALASIPRRQRSTHVLTFNDLQVAKMIVQKSLGISDEFVTA